MINTNTVKQDCISMQIHVFILLDTNVVVLQASIIQWLSKAMINWEGCGRKGTQRTDGGIIIIIIIVLLRHNGSKTYSSIHTHTVIHANTSTKKHKKILKTVKRNRTGKTSATLGLLCCAGECVPHSLLYCLPADASQRQTVQTANSNKSLWYQTWQRK